MTKKSQQNNSSISDKNMMVKKQHAILNVDFVNLIPKMLTISSAPVVLGCWLCIFCLLDTTWQQKAVSKALILKNNLTYKFKHQQDPEYICKVRHCAFWLNISIQTATKLKHAKLV